jgi:TolA-binding protein
MALTSLESISEKLAETKKVNLEALLIASGSAAVAKNEFGVTVVDNTNVASSLVFKNLSKPKYDETELLKAIDVEVIELKPNIPTPNLNLIPKPLYDEQVLLVEDLRKQVARLTTTIEDLNAQIITLQTQVQTEINNRLSVEQTNDVLVNQIDTLTNTINDFSNQIAISLQKSVDESILRASLQSQKTGFKAQIEALIQQINSLNAIIEGLQAQLGAVRQQKDLEQSHATNKSKMPAYEPPNAHYTQVTLPKHIKPEVFIGREGCHLKRITELSKCDYLWYDFKRGVIEVWGKESRLPKALKMLNKRIASFDTLTQENVTVLKKPLPPPPSTVPWEFHEASKELQERIKVISWEDYPRSIWYIISGSEPDVMKFYFENILARYPNNPYFTNIRDKDVKLDGTIQLTVKRSSTCE